MFSYLRDIPVIGGFFAPPNAGHPSPDRGTPPLPADLPSGRVTQENRQMKEEKRTLRRKPESSDLQDEPDFKRRSARNLPSGVTTRSTTNKANATTRTRIRFSPIPSCSASRRQTVKKIDKKNEKEVDQLYRRLLDLKKEEIENKFEEEDSRKATNKIVAKFAALLISDNGCQIDAAALVVSSCSKHPISTTTFRQTTEKMKKDLIRDKKELKAGGIVGYFGKGSEKLEVYNTVTNQNVSMVKFIQNNDIPKNEPKGPQVRCKCKGSSCSIDCPCLNRSINATKGFIFGKMLFKAEGEGFWNSGAVACGMDCGCRGSCSFGSQQLENLQSPPSIVIHQKNEHMGFALRATKNIPQGQFVCEFRGEVHDKVSRSPSTTYAFQTIAKDGDHSYLNLQYYSKVSKPKLMNYYIDPTSSGNAGRFANTSEHPNLFPIRVWTNSLGPAHVKFFFVSSQNIHAGEELFVDYGDDFRKDHLANVECRCLSNFCRMSTKLEGWTLEQKIELMAVKNKHIGDLIKKEGQDWETVMKMWTQPKQALFSQALRALLNRGLFYNAKGHGTKAKDDFNKHFFNKQEKIQLKNELLCSTAQLILRKKYGPKEAAL